MTRYILGRIASLLFSLFAVSVIIFVTVRAVPGGPWSEEKIPLTGAARANTLRKYGLDKPLVQQYWVFLKNAVRLDLGNSFKSPDDTVLGLIGRVWRPTFQIGLATVLITFVGGLTLGIIAATKRNTPLDYFITFFSTVGITVPNFVVAVWLILIFSLYLHLLPTSGWGSPKQMIMPVIAYCLSPMGVVARFTRVFMLEAMTGDYVRTARAKGLKERTIVTRHILKNALIPLLTILGPLVPDLMTGSIFIELTFGVPGLGRYWVTSILDRDYPVIIALMLLIALVWGSLYLITDLLYTVIDPRVRLKAEKGE